MRGKACCERAAGQAASVLRLTPSSGRRLARLGALLAVREGAEEVGRKLVGGWLGRVSPDEAAAASAAGEAATELPVGHCLQASSRDSALVPAMAIAAMMLSVSRLPASKRLIASLAEIRSWRAMRRSVE